MAGEGYDCPDIAVIGFASNKLTKSYVHQVVARGMRVTDVERKRGKVIPAAVVVPDVKILVDHLVEYLAAYSPEILGDETPPPPPPPPPGGERTCFNCGHSRLDHPYRGACRASGCDCPQYEAPMTPGGRFDVDNIGVPVENVTVSDGFGEVLGNFPRDEVDRWATVLERVHLLAVDAPRVMAGINLMREERPFDDIPSPDDMVKEATKRRATVEEHARMLQKRLHKLEGWWRYQGDTDIAVFVSILNGAAGISKGGREQATPQQLACAIDQATMLIQQLCDRTGKRPPKTMQAGGWS